MYDGHARTGGDGTKRLAGATDGGSADGCAAASGCVAEDTPAKKDKSKGKAAATASGGGGGRSGGGGSGSGDDDSDSGSGDDGSGSGAPGARPPTRSAAAKADE